MSLRSTFLIFTALSGGCLSALATPGLADDLDGLLPQGPLPAVSDVNGKIAGAFGSFDGDAVAFTTGSVTVPLGHAYGFQADALAGSLGGDGTGGVAGHAFWRDPSRGLFGGYASYMHVGGARRANDLVNLGAEGEVYYGRVSLEGAAGVQFADGDAGAFGSAGIAFYPVDDLRLNVAYRYTNEFSIGVIGLEWQPRADWAPGLSLFADGRVADDGRWAAFAGLRYYFGADKSLIRRHREDDPVNVLLPDDLFGLGAEEPQGCQGIILDGICVGAT